MKAEYNGEQVLLGAEGKSLYDQGGYGRPDKNGLKLSPEEALYLLGRNKIEVKGHSFESLFAAFTEESDFLRKFLVYRDIRERGYVIQSGPHDFRVFRRGEKPGTGRSQYLMRVLSERDLVDFGKFAEEAQTARNMRKQFLLAVADDEDEITYYEIKTSDPQKGECEPELPKISGKIFGKSVLISIPPESIFEEKLFGTRFDKERLMLSPVEAIYLIRKGFLELDEKISPEDYYKKIEDGDHEFELKSKSYAHLRDLWHIPRTAYKFGHHFRVYSGSKKHSELLVHALSSDKTMPMSVISRSVRLAHSVRKKMLFACVSKDMIKYIEFARIKL
ncbi:tRNA-intron lyase [Methanoplanus sp. FWC-SCC4]|uniref:tRNA-intron lyase n=1 Tax=Methanochimaera problematica TaxID=2609417 RepID=A0AA97FBQ4_9EURY|nr:tRNA-intron lyase [Methanoplanus sp. FWC-SCC4]WOF15274.1 tRNA-intron lyase [Methanoplanus sp. FWC-SCC4]